MSKISETDLKKLYAPKDIEIVDVPKLRYIMIDGFGNPNTAQVYKDALEALYAVSYGLKFAIKKEEGFDYKVNPLEGLWWSENMATFRADQKDDWLWTMMIMQPNAVNKAWFEKIYAEVKKKKNPVALDKLRLEDFSEGLCAQIMHIGPYSAEGPTIDRLHAFILENDYQLDGKHHEIYLSDPNRTAPERMKTVIRQPIKR